ncbi:MAG: hypothetical protein ACWA5X_13070 [bacterium]
MPPPYLRAVFFAASGLLPALLTGCHPGAELLPISSDIPNLQAREVEASGIVALPKQASSYLLISDELRGEQAELFQMDAQGAISQTYSISAPTRLDDLESISYSDDGLIVCSSLNANKKGKVPKGRRYCALLPVPTTSGEIIQAKAEINLWDTLKQAATRSSEKRIGQFVQKALKQKTLNIEAHALSGGELLMGIKSPLFKGQSVVVSLGSLEQVMRGNPSLRSWARLSLRETPEQKRNKSRLTDMTFVNQSTLLLTSSGKHFSTLWRYKVKEHQLQPLAQFDKVKAEGVTYDPNTHSAMVVIDGRQRGPSLFSRVPLD